jgi:hypothetical protein
MGGLDPGARLSSRVAAEAAAMFGCTPAGASAADPGGSGGVCGDKGAVAMTLADAMGLVHAAATRLPPISEQLVVIWEVGQPCLAAWRPGLWLGLLGEEM